MPGRDDTAFIKDVSVIQLLSPRTEFQRYVWYFSVPRQSSSKFKLGDTFTSVWDIDSLLA